jgi:RHS repeat-associated protein
VLSDTQGHVERHDYLPFGDELFAGVGSRTTAQGYLNNTDPETIQAAFTGQYRDPEDVSSAMPSGLDYFGARYYSGTQGRFTSPDEPLIYQNPSNPQTWNLYTYGLNNPLLFVDPDGHSMAAIRLHVETFGAPISQYVWCRDALPVPDYRRFSAA